LPCIDPETGSGNSDQLYRLAECSIGIAGVHTEFDKHLGAQCMGYPSYALRQGWRDQI
jgi:hypothetical protein